MLGIFKKVCRLLIFNFLFTKAEKLIFIFLSEKMHRFLYVTCKNSVTISIKLLARSTVAQWLRM